MKYTTSILLAASGLASALTQTCTGEAVDEGGNWFCGAVNEIFYEGFTQSGAYLDVTSMSDSGECVTENKTYSGPLSPLDEGLSIHIRGPINFKQFAVYHLANERKRDLNPSPHVHARRNGHQHFHDQRKKKRAEWVTATINGDVVSWENNYFGPSTAVADNAGAATTAPVVDDVDSTTTTTQTTTLTKTATAAAKTETKTSSKTSSKSGSSKSSSSKSKSSSSSTGAWERTSYYNAEQQTADNLVFLGNYGGQGSGIWDTTWGNSLSYVNAQGNGCSDSPKILGDVYIPSNTEVALFTAEKCDSTCGYSRVDEMAYKGFSGANKIFLFQFKMPLDGKRDFNGDMPALWALNSRIPRTAQYADCSCWTSGCGEADFYEVLKAGDTKCKSTFHLQNGAGSSDYFDRPTDDYVKIAVIFWESTATVAIKQLDSDFSFDEGLDSATVTEWLGSVSSSSKGTSLFQVAS